MQMHGSKLLSSASGDIYVAFNGQARHVTSMLHSMLKQDMLEIGRLQKSDFVYGGRHTAEQAGFK